MWFISQAIFKKLLKNIPRKPLTNIDLLKYVKLLQIPYFRGIFMRNELPKKINNIEYGIINLDDSKGEGSHWTAYVKQGKMIKYFDSFGNLRPPMELISYFYSDGKNNLVKYNHNRYQKYDKTNCGQLCLQFLYKNIKHHI